MRTLARRDALTRALRADVARRWGASRTFRPHHGPGDRHAGGGAGGRPPGQLAVFGYAAEASRSVPVACGAPIWTSIRLGARERTAFGRVTSRIPFS